MKKSYILLTNRPPQFTQKAHAAVMGLALAAGNMISCIDLLEAEKTPLPGKARFWINDLKKRADNFQVEMSQRFDMQDADTTNILGNALQEAQLLFLQLNPTQMSYALQHMAQMAESGASWVPATPQ